MILLQDGKKKKKKLKTNFFPRKDFRILDSDVIKVFAKKKKSSSVSHKSSKEWVYVCVCCFVCSYFINTVKIPTEILCFDISMPKG